MFYYVEWIHFSFESVSHFRNLTKPIYLKKKKLKSLKKYLFKY